MITEHLKANVDDKNKMQELKRNYDAKVAEFATVQNNMSRLSDDHTSQVDQVRDEHAQVLQNMENDHKANLENLNKEGIPNDKSKG